MQRLDLKVSGLIFCLLLAGNAMASNPVSRTHSYNGLALTPPMGFNDWAHYQCHISQRLFVQTANALVNTGLAKLGYRYVNIDDCWMARYRNAAGHLVANRKLFPRGMKWLGAYLHAKGLKFGIYEDAGYKTCQGKPGIYGHIQEDVRTFASWGVDYLKLDYCYPPDNRFPGKNFSQVAHLVYAKVSRALRHSGHAIVFSCSPPAYVFGKPKLFAQVMSWIGSVCNLWRTDDDIFDAWKSVLANFNGNVTLGRFSHPGGWNDPDMLEVGNRGLTIREQRTQFSLWAEMAAPLLISTDVARLSPAALKILSNAAVIAVDQDPLGIQATLIKQEGSVDILSRPLINGDHAVILFNKGSKRTYATVSLKQLGLNPGRYRLQNLWTKQITWTHRRIAAEVRSHGVVMYRLHAIP
ncbi:MAG: glycoside hydrolase family 27 protein [Gammaproteobacteria bacterium]